MSALGWDLYEAVRNERYPEKDNCSPSWMPWLERMKRSCLAQSLHSLP